MNHNITLNNRSELNITGIKKVRSTEPGQVILFLENGGLVIHGSNMSVSNLDIKEGTLSITGTVNNIKYTNTISKSFSFKNIFK